MERNVPNESNEASTKPSLPTQVAQSFHKRRSMVSIRWQKSGRHSCECERIGESEGEVTVASVEKVKEGREEDVRHEHYDEADQEERRCILPLTGHERVSVSARL